VQVDISDLDSLKKVIGKHDAVVSCLPYHMNLNVARAAHAVDKHYFDPTEDVPTTRGIFSNLQKPPRDSWLLNAA
tara:strand:+ start:336 stop:560 length:225 start_codon:yes stop_codon:yes gene_type:complete